MDDELMKLEAKKNMVIRTHKNNKICWIIGIIIASLGIIGCSISIFTGEIEFLFWFSLSLFIIGFILFITALVSDAMKYDKNLAACNAEIERWTALTPEEREKEKDEKYRATFNLPLKCPRCDQEAKWRYADSEEKETFDSAYTIGGNTTVYMKKNVTRRFVCDKCGFDIKRTS